MENWLNKASLVLGKVGTFSRWANMLGLTVFFLMVCLNFLDVFMRYFFNSPIMGAKEITSMMLVVLGALGIAYAQKEKSHISIDLFINWLSPRGRSALNTFVTLMSIGLFVVLTWRTAAQFLYFLENKTIQTYTIYIYSAPFAALVSFGCAMVLLLLVRDLCDSLVEGIRIQVRGYQWLLMSVIFIAVIVLFALWMQPQLWQMSLAAVGILGLIFSLILMFIGMPISFALILTGFLFIGHIRGTFTAFDMIGAETFTTLTNYLWAVIAFFMLMGFYVLYARFGEELYRTAYRWIGHWRGGLAQATVSACAAMAAIVGDTLSVAVTMGTVSLPEMERYKYDSRLSTGVISAGSTLGPMIPPSMGFILYAILTQQSIGKLFIAGIVPGLLLALAFMITVYFQCRLRPAFGPPGERSNWGDRMVSLKSGGPVVILFLLVIGGIYTGIFTPTEGGGIGAAGALIIGLVMRRINRQKFYNALLEAGKNMGFLLLILIGATIFTRFVAWCNLAVVVREAMTGLALPPSVIIMIILLIFFVLGFVIDTMPLILIGVPIFHPIAIALGYDPTWMAVLVIALIQLGQITPPVAVVLWAMKGVAKDVPILTLYKGIFPFVLATVIVIIVMFLVPSMVTWLPDLLY